jgi:hypothetical protein
VVDLTSRENIPDPREHVDKPLEVLLECLGNLTSVGVSIISREQHADVRRDSED